MHSNDTLRSRLFSLFSGDSTRSLLIRVFLPVVIAILLVENSFDALVTITPSGSRVFVIAAKIIISVLITVIAVYWVSRRSGNRIDGAQKELSMAMEALSASERKFRLLSEHALAGTYIIQDRKFPYVNPKFAEIFGYTRDEIMADMGLEELVEEEDLPLVLKSIRKRLEENVPSVHYSFKGIKKDGTLIDIEVYGSRTEYQGRPAIIGTLADITERKKTEAQILEAYGLYDKILSNLNEAVFIVDPETGRISLCNQTVETMFGYSAEELRGRDKSILFVSAQDWKRFTARLGTNFDHFGHLEFELQMRRKNGDIIETKHFLAPLHNKEHRLMGIVCVVRDVTEQKKSEAVIQEANERFATIMDSLNAFVYVADMQTHEVLFTNKYGRDMFGEIIGKVCYKTIQTDQQGPCEFCTNARLVNAEGKPAEVHTWEFQNTRNGKYYHIQDRAIYWTDGRIVRLEIATDITERKKTEKLLVETERRFREIFENVQLVGLGLDIEGNITFCNDFMLSLTGYTREEVIGKNWFDLFICRDGKIRQIFYKTMGEGAIPPHFDNPIITKQGEQRIIAWSNTVLRDHDGVVIGVASIGEDVTARKILEAQLLQSQKMESIGTLAGGIAHDFNNILTAIIGFGNVLKRKFQQDDPLIFYVDQILDASESAANLTRSLLAFGRKQIMNPKPCDLNEVISKLEKFLRRIIREDIEFTTSLHPASLMIMGDFGQMEQVLMNLAANARDALPKGGLVTITTRITRMDNEFVKAHGYGKPGEYAHLLISDNGIGMDEHTLNRIFEPFFTTKDLHQGTGLGLSIVYGIVKQHNGYINVDSRPGQGTKVGIFFPVIPGFSIASRDSSHKNAAMPGAKGSETVLIAEDNDLIRKLIKTVLAESGYTVIVAEDGESALERCRENNYSFDLFLLDVIMPRKSGGEVCDDILKNKPGAKIILLSGYTADIVDKCVLSEKKVNFLSKPVSPAELLRKVREVLDGDLVQR